MPKIADQWLHKVLDAMHQRRTATRAQIVQATKLNPASVSHALQYLLERGTILKVGELQSKAGRRRDVLTLNAEAGYFVVADLEGAHMCFAITNFVGDIRYRWEEDIKVGRTLEVKEICDGIQMVLRGLTDAQRSRLLAIGISCPGIWHKGGGVTAFNLGWRKMPLASNLEANFDLPVYLEHSTRCAIMAERWLGLGQNVRNFAFVTVGYGVGVGIFSNGRFVGGRDKMAGELGHITIDPAARDLCRCGKTGCLEAIVSSPNVVRQYLELSGQEHQPIVGLRVGDIFDRYKAGDPYAAQVINRASKYLGLALSYLVNFLNPELIILGDDLVGGEDIFLPRIRSEIEANSLPDFVENLEIRVSRLGHDIGLKGAASFAFRNSLNNAAVLQKMCRPAVESHEPIEAQDVASPHSTSSRSGSALV